VTALAHPHGTIETNRSHALQIELVAFAGTPKHPDALKNMSKLCRWLEATHNVPPVWPNGLPKPSSNGHDPGHHNRNEHNWRTMGGHYGHCNVPGNKHWDPGYTTKEANVVVPAITPAEEVVADAGIHLLAEKAELPEMGLLANVLDNAAFVSFDNPTTEDLEPELEELDSTPSDKAAEDRIADLVRVLSADGPRLPDGRPYFYPNGISRIQVKVGTGSNATPEVCIDVEGPPEKTARTRAGQ
jgi:hypothetical protein